MLLAELSFNVTRALRTLRGPAIALLAIELLDELVFGAREAAWPALREELELSYVQIGVLLSVPTYSSALLEPVFGILGDSRWRRTVVVAGGIGTATALALVAGAPGFVVLLVAFALLFPSTGAFVSLSQATLMDLEPERRELNMTRWSIAGGVGAVAGPLLLVLFTAVGAGWRGLFATFAVLALALTVLAAATHSRVRPHAGRPSVRGRSSRSAGRSSRAGSSCSSSPTCSSTCCSDMWRSTSSTKRARRRRSGASASRCGPAPGSSVASV
jgi:MFS family permease